MYLRFKEVRLAMGSKNVTVCLYYILSFFDMFAQFLLLQTSMKLLVTLEQDILVTIVQIYLLTSSKSK